MADSVLGLDVGDFPLASVAAPQGQEAASPLNFAASLRLVSIMPPASPAVDEWYYVGTRVSRSGVDAATRASGRSLKAEANFRFGSRGDIQLGGEACAAGSRIPPFRSTTLCTRRIAPAYFFNRA